MNKKKPGKEDATHLASASVTLFLETIAECRVEVFYRAGCDILKRLASESEYSLPTRDHGMRTAINSLVMPFWPLVRPYRFFCGRSSGDGSR